MRHRKCAYCGATLDPGESCDCRKVADDQKAENPEDENEAEKKRETPASENPHVYCTTREDQNQGGYSMSYSKQKKFDRALCRFISSAEELFVSVSADSEVVISDHSLTIKMPLSKISVEVKAEVYKRMEVIPAPSMAKTHSKTYGNRNNTLSPNSFDMKDYKYMYQFTDLIHKAITDLGQGAHVYYRSCNTIYSYKLIQSKYINLMQNLQVRTHVAHTADTSITGILLFRSESINVFIAPLRCNSSTDFLKGVEA